MSGEKAGHFLLFLFPIYFIFLGDPFQLNAPVGPLNTNPILVVYLYSSGEKKMFNSVDT